MIIIETCPRCGGDLRDEVIATYPPVPRKSCPKCGWFWEGVRERVMRVPFREPGVPYMEAPTAISSLNVSTPPCATCGSNPKNGGSGNCHCILGTPTIT